MNGVRTGLVGLLLGFCCFDESEIESGIDVLSDIIERQVSATRA